MKIRKLIFDDEKPTRKNAGDLREWRDDEQEPVEEWEPPNYYYRYTFPDRNQTRAFRDLDNNLKKGLENMAISQYETLGRYGMWPEWGEIDEETKEYYEGWLHKWGHTFKNAQFLYADYIRCANYFLMPLFTGADIIDPSERSKLYFITDLYYVWRDPWTREEKRGRFTTFPNGSPLGGPVDVRNPEARKWEDLTWTGTQLTYIGRDGAYHKTYADVSMNSRTLKRRK